MTKKVNDVEKEIKELKNKNKELKEKNKEFLEDIAFYQNRLKETEELLEAFKNEKGIISLNEYESLLKAFNRAEEAKRLYKGQSENWERKYNDLLIKTNDLRDKDLKRRRAGRKSYSNEDVVVKIFDMYLNYKSLQKIADILNSTGEGNKNNWSKSTVRHILLNDEYVRKGMVTEKAYSDSKLLLNSNRSSKKKALK